MQQDNAFENLQGSLSMAVSTYWQIREQQQNKQSIEGRSDQGLRGAVTGGAQMSGFISLFARLISDAGIPPNSIFTGKNLEIPGYFRPTKEWDLLVVDKGRLVAAIEAKSQVGPSFGNNFNNRTEEAIGSALDLWTAYREGAFNGNLQPFLGYFFLLEESRASTMPVKVSQPHFPVFPEFLNASYASRYETFCRKLVRERQYTATSFILTNRERGVNGFYREPAEDLRFEVFARALVAHVSAFIG